MTARKNKRMRILMDKDSYEKTIKRIKAFSEYFTGNFPVDIYADKISGAAKLVLYIEYNKYIVEELEHIVGKENISLE
jgi:hypothetical protein